MRKLKFKITLYKYNNNVINEENIYDELVCDDAKSLYDILKVIVKKYRKEEKDNQSVCIYIWNFYEMFWGQYFNKNQGLCDEREQHNYYDYKIGDLCKQFNLEKQIIELAINPPIGGDVGRNNGIHYFFHTNEKDIHHVPHIHVKSGSVEFRVNLNTLEIMDKNTFKNNKKNKLALEMIRKNQQDLINYWNKVVINGESVKFKMFFPC